jgi:hypothetical protein
VGRPQSDLVPSKEQENNKVSFICIESCDDDWNQSSSSCGGTNTSVSTIEFVDLSIKVVRLARNEGTWLND